jgi:hypothetical protein
MGPKAPDQGQTTNSAHATNMAKIAATRASARKMLTGGSPAANATASQPSSAAGGAGNWKSQVLGVLQAHGVQAGVHHIHAAIDTLKAQGRFTPFQAHALKAHNGPLAGPQGQATMGAVAGQLMPKPAAPAAPAMPQRPAMPQQPAMPQRPAAPMMGGGGM